MLEAHPHARFRTVGQPFGRELAERFGAERASAVPFAALDSYPAAMAAFDVALAPAAPSAFFTAKSDLRFLEAAALGLPVVADPVVYPSLVHGETGLHAATPRRGARAPARRWSAIRSLRRRLGTAARAYVERERAMPAAAHRGRSPSPPCGPAPRSRSDLKIAMSRPTTGS